jgi:integrase
VYRNPILAEEWRPHEWDPQSWVFTGDVNEPLTAVSICITPACDTPIDGTHGRCNACRKAIVRYASPADFDRSYDPSWRRADDSRYLTARQFSLADRSPLMQSEVLFALQQRDQDRQTLRPWLLAKLMDKLDPNTSSILDVGEAGLNASQLGLLRSLQLQVNRLRMAFLGEGGTSGEVWDVALVGLRSAPNRPYRAVFGTLHFRGIRQHWLRDIVLEVTRARRPSVTVAHRDVQAAEIASAALCGRPHSDKPEALGLADMTEIYRAFKTARDPDTGELYSVTYRRGLLGSWRRLLSFARPAELMDHVPGSFALTAGHQIKPEETNEDEIGRAIPEEWIAQLDKHLPLLGSTSTYANGGWSAEDYAAMYQTVYALLRDTGRRPNEIVGLPRNPSEYRDGEPLLVWDNGKARRLRRRLPIDESTAEIIKIWEKRLATLPVPPACRGLLFPAPGGRNQARRGHLAPNQFRKMFVAWLAVVPDPEHLPADSLGFSRDDIEPYGLRHAYAQRHADNGTPVDVLRELMDHKSVDTTMGTTPSP